MLYYAAYGINLQQINLKKTQPKINVKLTKNLVRYSAIYTFYMFQFTLRVMDK